jgi:hypothetical protein
LEVMRMCEERGVGFSTMTGDHNVIEKVLAELS